MPSLKLELWWDGDTTVLITIQSHVGSHVTFMLYVLSYVNKLFSGKIYIVHGTHYA